MAIYHMQAKVVSRGSGRSAVAASAYMSCSRMYNDYDGIQHDYTRKHGLIYQEVLLPPMASPEWKDREQLWNAVEAAEKTKDSRLAREFVVALPIELDKDSNISLLQNFIILPTAVQPKLFPLYSATTRNTLCEFLELSRCSPNLHASMRFFSLLA